MELIEACRTAMDVCATLNEGVYWTVLKLTEGKSIMHSTERMLEKPTWLAWRPLMSRFDPN